MDKKLDTDENKQDKDKEKWNTDNDKIKRIKNKK